MIFDNKTNQIYFEHLGVDLHLLQLAARINIFSEKIIAVTNPPKKISEHRQLVLPTVKSPMSPGEI